MSAIAHPQASATTSTLLVDPGTHLKSDPMKMLSVCCCCLVNAIDEPQPINGHYRGECSKAGTRDVCGSNYTGTSGYAMYGLEGDPERIGALCSTARCGAMRYMD